MFNKIKKIKKSDSHTETTLSNALSGTTCNAFTYHQGAMEHILKSPGLLRLAVDYGGKHTLIALSHTQTRHLGGEDALNDGEMLDRKRKEKETWKNTGTLAVP